jgi:hypothetical protein
MFTFEGHLTDSHIVCITICFCTMCVPSELNFGKNISSLGLLVHWESLEAHAYPTWKKQLFCL